MFEALAGLAVRRARLVLLVALVFAGVASYVGGSASEVMSNDRADFDAQGSQSSAARDRLAQAAGANPGADFVALVRAANGDVRSEAAKAEVLDVARRIANDPGVGRVSTVYETGDPAMISEDGAETYVVAGLKPGASGAEAAKRLADEFSGDEIDVTLGGEQPFGADVTGVLDEDLVRAELLAFPILLVLLLIIFRGLVAALLPLLVGGLAVIGSLLGLRIVAEFVPISIFALNMVSALGLGLALDYSLLILSRYREEIARCGPGRQALSSTLKTAGRTVLISSLTVAVALSSLAVFQPRFFYSIAIGGVLVALLASSAALVVLPALLALLRRRVNALSFGRLRRASEREASSVPSGRWYRFARSSVMRRPALAALAAAALLLGAGLPFLGVRFTAGDASMLPEDRGTREVYDALQRGFPNGDVSPLNLAIQAPGGNEAAGDLSDYAARIEELPNVAAVSPPKELADGSTWQIDVLPKTAPLSDESRDLVQDVRALDAPYPVEVGGLTAAFVDRQESIIDGLPIALALVFASTFVLLFLLTGSVIVPAKTFIMNLLTVLATFGVLVWIFQDGRFEELLHYHSPGALENTEIVVVLVLAFALSTDYGVFLLSRIKEAYDSGLGNAEAVALGLGRTGRIVTAGALLFCVAVGAMASSRIVSLQELGVGASLAVLIDATIVRALLVPSLMRLLGRANWWAPAPLRWLHERVGLGEGTAAPTEEHPADDAVSMPPKAQVGAGKIGEPEALRDLATAAARLAEALESGEIEADPEIAEALIATAHDAWASFARLAVRKLGIRPGQLL